MGFGNALGRLLISIAIRCFFCFLSRSVCSVLSRGRFFRPIFDCVIGLIATLLRADERVVRPSALLEERVEGDAIDLDVFADHFLALGMN